MQRAAKRSFDCGEIGFSVLQQSDLVARNKGGQRRVLSVKKAA